MAYSFNLYLCELTIDFINDIEGSIIPYTEWVIAMRLQLPNWLGNLTQPIVLKINNL